MNFKEFLLTEATFTKPTVITDVKHMTDVLNKNMSDALDHARNNQILYRGMPEKGDFVFQYAKDISRKSTQVMGEKVTLLMDNLPSWQGWASRTKSVICSSAYSKASNYGSVFVILAANGTTLNVCPDTDIKTSFIKMNEYGKDENSRVVNTQDFAMTIGKIFKACGLKEQDAFTVSSLKMLTAVRLKEAIEHAQLIKSDSSTLKVYLRMIEKNKCKNLFDALNIIMDPTENGFEQQSISAKYPNANSEIWFNGNYAGVKMQAAATPALQTFCTLTKLPIEIFIK